jgi:hypothetical protein
VIFVVWSSSAEHLRIAMRTAVKLSVVYANRLQIALLGGTAEHLREAEGLRIQDWRAAS